MVEKTHAEIEIQAQGSGIAKELIQKKIRCDSGPLKLSTLLILS
jgi:hypothetical protein